MSLKPVFLAAGALLASTVLVSADTITIATVNNGNMVRTQGLTANFTEKTGHEVEWVTLEENVLRQRVTQDIATKGGQFDVMTIGMCETPIWAAQDWLVSLNDLPESCDIDGILPAMRAGLSHEDTLYAAPFYGESSMVMYRTDLMEAAGLEMPEALTWDFIAASFVTNPDDSNVADKVSFALAPDAGLGKRANWLWAWALGIPAGTQKEEAAKAFVNWATSKEYLELVAENEGWANVPPGTCTSLYENAEYQKVPFAAMTLESINVADPTAPAVDPVSYVGIQFVAIPELAGIGTQTGQEFSAALAGQQTAEEALEKAQALTADEMEAAGY